MEKLVATIDGEEYEAQREPLWYHLQGLCQTATGYGKKLRTEYTVMYKGRKRRIYNCCFSNVGTLYIIVSSKSIIVDLH